MAAGSSRVKRLQAVQDLIHSSGSSGQGVTQAKLLRWDNPVLKADSIATPSSGATEAAAAAKTIDSGVEAGSRDVVKWITAYQKGGKTTSDDVKGYFTGKASSGHVSNFVNRLIDWGKAGSGTKLRLVKASAGYIIEDYAKSKAQSIGAQSQFSSGGARPDFKFATKKTWSNNSNTHAADALIDATTSAEASKGHVSEKVTRMLESDAYDHPHLYDSYYQSLAIDSSKPTVSLLEEASEAYRDRQWEMRRRIRRNRARRKSLRPRNKYGKVKLSGLGKYRYGYSPY